jgi:hypothetical protein
MDRLLRSMKDSANQASAAYYIYIVTVVLFTVLAAILVFLYIKLGSIQAIQQAFPNIPFQRVLYLIAGLVILMIVLMLFNSQYEVYFQKRQTDGVYSRTLPSSKMFWSPASTPNPQDPMGLKITSSEFPMTSSDTYTMGIVLYVGDSRSTDKTGPYRHILHRGTDDLIKFVRDSPGSVPRGRGDLNDGLPHQMNPGLFLDPYTNDLLIYIDTDPYIGGQANRESLRISDLPLKKPFHVHVVVQSNMVEVYINCRLAVSKILNGMPRAVPNDWYGRIGFARAAVVPQDLTLWDTDLHALEIRKQCKAIEMPTLVAPTAGYSNC